MSLANFIKSLRENPNKRTKIITIITMTYNFFWAIGKILFGAFMRAYLYCISGAYTLLLGFGKKIFVSNHQVKDVDIETKSLIMGILLTISGIAFGIYMGLIYVWEYEFRYSLILSIAIAACSFVEFGIAIYNLVKARRKKDLLMESLRCCNIGASLFAIVMTQVALLSSQNVPDNYIYNSISGVIASVLVIILGFVVIGKSAYLKNKEEEMKKLEINLDKVTQNSVDNDQILETLSKKTVENQIEINSTNPNEKDEQ